MIESWKDKQTVTLLDAINSGERHGNISRFHAHDQPIPGRFFSSLPHNFWVIAAVELARTLNRLPPCLIIYGIEGKKFKEGHWLSSSARKAAGAVPEVAINDIYYNNGNVSSKVENIGNVGRNLPWKIKKDTPSYLSKTRIL